MDGNRSYYGPDGQYINSRDFARRVRGAGKHPQNDDQGYVTGYFEGHNNPTQPGGEIPPYAPADYEHTIAAPDKSSKTRLRDIDGRNRNSILLIIIGCIGVILVGLSVILWHSNSQASNGKQSQNVQNAVHQPPSASEVAKQNNCINFHDQGPAAMGGVVDSGYCYIGGEKYAIDTFTGSNTRDEWLKGASKFGVNPKWESDTSVTYPSVDGNK